MSSGESAPSLSIWTRPRATVRHLVETDPTRHVLLLAALAGVAQVLDRASFASAGDTLPLSTIFLVALLLGPAFGIIGLYIGGALISWTGRWIGGSASAQHVRTAVAWAGVPAVAVLLLWIPALLVFGSELFTTAAPRVESSLGLALALVLFGAASVVLGVWSIVLLLKGVGEVQGFSAWRALGNVILGSLVIVVPVVVIAVAAGVLM